jgi:hypothetical protein
MVRLRQRKCDGYAVVLPADSYDLAAVHLDIPWSVCAGRAFRRGLRKPVGEMPEGCDDSAWRRLRDEWRLAVVIWRKRRSEPEREYEIISQYGQHGALYVLRSKPAAKEFLDALDIENTKADAG